MIEVEHLRMEYEGNVALENLRLEVPRGEVFGLIGPNGAGKTTLIRILATLLEPTYGRVRIAGIDVLAEPLRIHPLIGYMSDFFSLYETMLVWEYLDHFARCYGVDPRRRDRLVEEVLDLVSLEVRRDAEIRTLSRGMRQRLCFAKSLLHEPQLLLLDEPASGLDPAGRIEFRELLKKLREMGRTVLISSHILTEMADFCTSVGILEEGRLLDSGRVADILHAGPPRCSWPAKCSPMPARCWRCSSGSRRRGGSSAMASASAANGRAAGTNCPSCTAGSSRREFRSCRSVRRPTTWRTCT